MLFRNKLHVYNLQQTSIKASKYIFKCYDFHKHVKSYSKQKVFYHIIYVKIEVFSWNI